MPVRYEWTPEQQEQVKAANQWLLEALAKVMPGSEYLGKEQYQPLAQPIANALVPTTLEEAMHGAFNAIGVGPLAPIKQPLTMYHGTQSKKFSMFNPSLAEKGEQYFNPLGEGLYFTTNKNMAKEFGPNVFEYTLPQGTNVRKVTANQWRDKEYPDIFKKVMDELDFPIKDVHPSEYYRAKYNLGNNTPIDSLNNLHAWISAWDYHDPGHVEDVIQKIVNLRYKKYPAVRFMTTNYYDDADEILLKPKAFKGFK